MLPDQGSGGRPDRHLEPNTPFQRRTLHHVAPAWVQSGEDFFITVCCERRDENQLCTPSVGGSLIASALNYHERSRWYVSLLVLMPDHFHAILSFPSEEKLSELIRNWKSYTSRQLGITWQRNFFEHRVRGSEEFRLKADYIRQNPVRKGLIDDPRKWPYLLEH